MEGLAARRAAAHALGRVLDKHAMLDASLSGAPGFNDLPVADRGLARAITATALRRLGQIQRLLDQCLDRPLGETPPGARRALIIGAAQLCFMDVPDHAAVSTSVELVRADPRGGRKRAGLVNAVLRRLTREGDALAAQMAPSDALPGWLADRWRAAWGADRLEAIAQILLADPPLDITLKSPGAEAEWAESLDAEALPGGGLRRRRAGDVTSLPGFEGGSWWAQDAAAALPARLLRPQPGERIADLCAAPGGKTMQLAAAGASVTAVDISGPRLRRLEDNLRRTGLEAEIIKADLREWSAEDPFDAVLFDAPCSATGTLRRHPEGGWIKSEADIARLAKVQGELGLRAADLVRPGGRMMFCTCSLEPEEGEHWLSDFLDRRPDFSIDPVQPDEITGMEAARLENGAIRLTPEIWTERGGVDGFFIVRLSKSG